jgi:hypothetical protein
MQLAEAIPVKRASARIVHFRQKQDAGGNLLPVRWLEPEVPDLDSVDVLFEEVVHNVITTVGRDFLHTQTYGTAPAANGLNFIGLSNDVVTETSASTVLSNEIAANGLSRAVGAVAHTVGQNTTTVSKTFTCATGAQSAQKAALFTAGAAGTMNHVLGFTQRALQIGDQLAVTFTITAG